MAHQIGWVCILDVSELDDTPHERANTDSRVGTSLGKGNIRPPT
jgi:hypothetical protein